jgi:hypothetical protein
MNRGWVYCGNLDAEALVRLIQQLPERVLLSWELSRLDFPNGVQLRDAGCAFNREAEVRWEKITGGRYRVWILSDVQRSDLPEALRPVEGEWEIAESRTQLLNLGDRRFAPQFEVYPAVNAPEASLKCRVFYRDKVATFVSPREVRSNAQESER